MSGPRMLRRRAAPVLAALAVLTAGAGLPAAGAQRPPAPFAAAFLTARQGVLLAADAGTTYVYSTVDAARSLTLRLALHDRGVWSVGAAHGQAWFLSAPCGHPADCGHRRGRLYVSTDAGRTWRPRGTATFGEVSLFGSLGLASEPRRNGAPRLLASADGGRKWHVATTPWNPSQVPSDVFVAVTARRFYVAFGGGPATDMQFKWLYVSTDRGRSWRLVNRVSVPQAHPRSATLPLVGIITGLAMAPGGRGWMWLDRAAPADTSDGGYRWRQPASLLQHNGDYNAGLLDVLDMSAAGTGSPTYLLERDATGRNPEVRLLEAIRPGGRWRQVRAWLESGS